VAEGSVSFEQDIKPLFRDKDQRAMSYAFDLRNYDDVREHADGILARLEQGDMPCDEPWPPEQIDLFRRWRDTGTPA
jgi:hypothetical protein